MHNATQEFWAKGGQAQLKWEKIIRRTNESKNRNQ